jgi:polyisoprenoid-binding protein YceI
MFRLRHVAIIASLLLWAGVANSTPETYTIVSKISRVNFSLLHQGFIQLFGTLKIAPGTITFDTEDWSKSSVVVTMPVKMLDMGDALWNEQIRGDESWKKFFSTKEIGFRSTRLVRSDETHGVLYGDLTLAGVTKPVELQLHINKIGRNDVSKNESVGITATSTVKRSEFGLDAYEDLVGDDLAVQIQLEAAMGPDTDAKQEAKLNTQGVLGVQHH